jgi:hypothetical protein
MPIAQIAAFLKLSRFVVTSAINRLLESGTFFDRPRNGRPRSYTSRDIRQVKYDTIRNTVFSAAALSRTYHINRSAVSKRLSEFGFRPYSDKDIDLVTKRWLTARKKFYTRVRNVNFCNVSFSDEKSFQFNSDGRIKIYARSREEYRNKHKGVFYNPRKAIRVWGNITSKGTGKLIFLTKPWCGKAYVEEVLQPMIGSKKGIQQLFNNSSYIHRRWLFEQDNDPAHRSKESMMFLKKHNIRVLKWPPRSPDLNPIENVWGIMTRRIREKQIASGTSPDFECLKFEIQEAWDSITPELCNKLCKSVDKRLDVIKANRWMPYMK